MPLRTGLVSSSQSSAPQAEAFSTAQTSSAMQTSNTATDTSNASCANRRRRIPIRYPRTAIGDRFHPHRTKYSKRSLHVHKHNIADILQTDSPQNTLKEHPDWLGQAGNVGKRPDDQVRGLGAKRAPSPQEPKTLPSLAWFWRDPASAESVGRYQVDRTWLLRSGSRSHAQ